MKKVILIGTLTTVFCYLHAQTEFTFSAFAPQNGDVYTYGKFTSPNVGSPGADQHWDFTTLTNVGTTVYSVVPASSVPCGSQFPGATQAIGNGGAYTMLHITPTEYQFYGHSITPSMVGVVNSDARKEYSFPMQYADSFTDTYHGTGANNMAEYGNTTVTYDAYGTITTPYGIYPNALRIHQSYTITDSTNSVNCSGTQDYYYWFAPGYRYPVASVWSTTGNCGVGMGCEFLQSVTAGINDEATSIVSSISPNPLSEKSVVVVSKKLDGATLKIYNMNGQIVQQINNISGQEIVIERESMGNGLYYVSITQDNKTWPVDKLLVIDPR